jgi:lambda repressor-like predicted transcriptional regulator
MNANERESHWRQIIARQEESGLSVLAFCRQEELSTYTLYNWRRRFARQPRVKFAMVEVSPETRSTNANAGLELLLASGERFQIFAGVDAATLRTVLAALRERE